MEIWNRHFECMDRGELRQVQIMRDFGSTVLACTPSYALYLAEAIQESGIGRTMVRMEKCLGRSDDMLIIRGVNLFPSQVESALLEMSEIKPHYLLIVDRVNNLDTLELKVEVDEAFFLDKISQLESLRMKIQENLESSLGLGIKVTLVEPKMIERSEGKSQRVIDKRKF